MKEHKLGVPATHNLKKLNMTWSAPPWQMLGQSGPAMTAIANMC